MSYNCGYCGSGSSGNVNYSPLESIVSYSPSKTYDSGNISYLVTEQTLEKPRTISLDNSISTQAYNTKQEEYSVRSSPISSTYSHVTDQFLSLDRPQTVFIGSAREIREFVEETFAAVTGRSLPEDVMIQILGKDEFDKASKELTGRANFNVQGFAINRKKFGLLSEVFVRQGELDSIMLTLGHELGHVLTYQLDNRIDEEAKAFAFSIAWMQKIKELNIANLSTAIKLDRPASNGLHDIALNFVLDEIKQGNDAFGLFIELSEGVIGVDTNA